MKKTKWVVEDRRPVRPLKECGAKTRKGTPCKRKALNNGRCANHGGLCTGPKTPEGKTRALANLYKWHEQLRATINDKKKESSEQIFKKKSNNLTNDI